MVRKILFLLLFGMIISTHALAGLESLYDHPYGSGSVIAPVKIKGEKIYNLVVSVEFLNEPYERSVYKSKAYEKLIQRLKVEWSGRAVQKILLAKQQNLDDLSSLKKIIEKEIFSLSEKLKDDYGIEKTAEVVFSITHFFLLEPVQND